MNVCIAGSRSFTNQHLMDTVVLSHLLQTYSLPTLLSEFTLIYGGARGADRRGLNFAQRFFKDVKTFKPDWDKYGRSAGMVRNRQMALASDLVFVFWDGKSPGTKSMIELSRRFSNLILTQY